MPLITWGIESCVCFLHPHFTDTGSEGKSFLDYLFLPSTKDEENSAPEDECPGHPILSSLANGQIFRHS